MKRRLIVILSLSMMGQIPLNVNADDAIRFGVGTELTTYLAKGYSMTGACVLGKVELNLEFSKFKQPDWVLERTVDEVETENVGLLLKYNFCKDVTKLFVALGIAYIRDEVTYSTVSRIVEFRNTFLTGEIGYNIKIFNNWRMIPALSFGYVIGGDTEKIAEGYVCVAKNYAFGGNLTIAYYY